MRISIYKPTTAVQEEIEELIALLKAMGLEVIVLEAFADQPVAVDQTFSPDDVLYVLLSQGCGEDRPLAELTERVGRSGGRVIGVWPKRASEEEDVPLMMSWHGSAVVPWDGKKLAEAAAGEDSWETPSGARRIAPHTDRHKC